MTQRRVATLVLAIVALTVQAHPTSQAADRLRDSTSPTELGLRDSVHLQDLAADRREALAQGDWPRAATISLEINELLELSRLRDSQNRVSEPPFDKGILGLRDSFLGLRDSFLGLRDGEIDEQQYDARLGIKRKYEILRTRQADLAQAFASGQSAGMDFYGDFPIAYHPAELAATQDVFRELGDLFIPNEQVGQTGQGKWQSIKAKRPWSGYWYPARDPALFRGTQAPLAKVDTILARRGLASAIASWEKERWKNLVPDTWEGLCGAWAMASVVSSEPSGALTFEGVTLSVADQKGILTKIHEGYPSARYGIRYKGNYETDGTIQDLRPEAFHQLALTYLDQRDQAVVIDVDSGVEVWQQPLFRLDWRYEYDAEVPNALLVEARVLSVAPRQKETDQPTTNDDVTVTKYHYRLYVDREAREGHLKVIAGEWLGSSLGHHPDFVVVPAQSGAPATFNPELAKQLETLIDMLRQ